MLLNYKKTIQYQTVRPWCNNSIAIIYYPTHIKVLYTTWEI